MKLSAGLAMLAMLFGLSCGGQFITSNNEILSALTWACLDPQQPMQTSLDNIGINQLPYSNYTTVPSKQRKKRTLRFKETSFEIEYKFSFLLYEISEYSEISVEIPLSYEFEYDKEMEEEEEGRTWDTSLAPMITHLEELVSMLGVDGGVCIRRAICELAEAPSLQVHGFVGEVLHILMRHIIEDSMVEDENTINTNERTDSDNPSVSKGDYVKAGQHGRQKGECWKAYSECPVSLFNLMASP